MFSLTHRGAMLALVLFHGLFARAEYINCEYISYTALIRAEMRLLCESASLTRLKKHDYRGDAPASITRSLSVADTRESN